MLCISFCTKLIGQNTLLEKVSYLKGEDKEGNSFTSLIALLYYASTCTFASTCFFGAYLLNYFILIFGVHSFM